jgi:hypothetical protein
LELTLACGRDIEDEWSTWLRHLQAVLTYSNDSLGSEFPATAYDIIQEARTRVGSETDQEGVTDAAQSLAQRVQTAATEKMLNFADSVVKELEQKMNDAENEVT